jgi:hypothetical protein
LQPAPAVRSALAAITVVCLLATAEAQQTTILDPADASLDGSAILRTGASDARAVEEMLHGKSGRHSRWTERPSLVVVRTVLQFEGGQRKQYAATRGELTIAESEQMAEELREGLRLLTGDTFSSFASVRFERVAPGTHVPMDRSGVIVAGRFRGVRKTLNAAGYGGRTIRADDSIASGTVILDNEYDRTDGRRRLLRYHELGHALGYNHVESQRSIMNPTLGTEPTEFDRRVAAIAFRTPSLAVSRR